MSTIPAARDDRSSQLMKSHYRKLVDHLAQLVERLDIAEDSLETTFAIKEGAEVIGDTDRTDFPLLMGAEFMLEADFRGEKGQAFTTLGSAETVSVRDLLAIEPGKDLAETAVFIAALNAIMRYAGECDRTIHCSGQEPEECGAQVAEFVRSFGEDTKTLMVGYQPALVDHIMRIEADLRILDLNPANIGQERYGITVEHGDEDFDDATAWADLILVTGSTIVNGSLANFLVLDKPVWFFGNTLAGSAAALGLNRLCYEAG